MADDLGTLAVDLDLNTRGFNAGFYEADRRVDQFENRTRRASASVGRYFTRIAASATAMAAAITGAAVAIGGLIAFKFGRDAVNLAKDYELLGVRLKTLTGNTAGAERVLADVNQLVVETPFGLQEMGNAAASVGVIFKSNTAAVSEFTGVAADLAAAFGRPVEQIGENLTRAFASGLGAADAFREAGITAEILRITGETDVAKVSTEQLGEALRVMANQGGIAYQAAAKQAKTLGGALSNTVIAYQNLLRSVGQGLAPAIVSVTTEVIQPFFQDLQAQIEGSQEGIDSLVRDTIPWLVRGIGMVINVVAYAVGFIQALGTAWKVVKSAVVLAGFSLVALLTPIRVIVQAIGRLIATLWNLAKAVKAGISGDVEGAQSAFARAKQHVLSMKDDTVGAFQDLDTAGRMAAESLATTWEDKPGGALERFTDLLATAKYQVDDLAGRLERWRDRGAAREEEKAPGARPQADIDWDKLFGGGEAPWLKTLGDNLESTVKEAMVNGLTGGDFDFKDLASNLAGEVQRALAEQAVTKFMDDLKAGFTSLSKVVGGLFKETLGKAFEGIDFGGFGDQLGGAIGGAASIGFSLLMGSIGGTKKRQTFADIQRASNVTSTQEVRGVVAGPTNIAVAQVGNQIADAMEPLVSVAREQLDVLNSILAAVSGGYGASRGIESEASQMLQNSALLT